VQKNEKFIAFNEEVGEWLCTVVSVEKGKLLAKRLELLRAISLEREKLALAFCVIKPDKTKFLMEKCTELGVTDFYPLISRYTNYNVNLSKSKLIVTGAAEQSERLDIPHIHSETKFENFVNDLPLNFNWISAVERQISKSILDIEIVPHMNYGFIIGPEGGFSQTEIELLLEKTIQVTLSNNILRSETAAISCISVFNVLMRKRSSSD
jgi:16S rRNA (uracil1498-N3)-methyltransferase